MSKDSYTEEFPEISDEELNRWRERFNARRYSFRGDYNDIGIEEMTPQYDGLYPFPRGDEWE